MEWRIRGMTIHYLFGNVLKYLRVNDKTIDVATVILVSYGKLFSDIRRSLSPRLRRLLQGEKGRYVTAWSVSSMSGL